MSVVSDIQNEASSNEAPHPSSPPSDTIRVIEPRTTWQVINGRELWRYRELLMFLVWRDVKVRYKQTALGVMWAVIQPLATMLVFSLIVSRVTEVKQDSALPYPVYAFIGFLAWTFFANSITASSSSILSNANLVTKVYCPRLLIPMGVVLATLLDFFVGSLMLVPLLLWFGIVPGPTLLLAPMLLLGLIAAAMGMGIWLAALTVAYRDMRYVVPFGVQLWMFATPAVYITSHTTNDTLGSVLLCNPLNGLIAALRATLTNTPIDPHSTLTALAMVGVILITGCFYFRQVERRFADIL